MARKKVTGVYMIYCTTNRRMYIGSSVNVRVRKMNHWNYLKRGVNAKLIQEDWNKYGREGFEFHLVKQCVPDERKFWELTYINKFQTNLPMHGYNIQSPLYGKLVNGGNRNVCSVDKVVSIHTETGEVTKHSSALIASEKLLIPRSKIADCCGYWRGIKTSRRSIRGYMFVKGSEYDDSFDYIGYVPERIKKEPKVKAAPILPIDRNVKRCSIEAEELTTGIVIVYPMIKSMIEQLGLNRKKVYKCLDNDYKKYQHKGYYFRRV